MLNLPIFPEGGLTSSVITTVWVGVFVIAFFNLRYGWVLSGLVVPGYLVPLLILRPLAALVIVFEAVLTYLIVWLFSERLSRGRFNALFGRDRFMGLVLASIAVRAGLDGWLLPQAADWLSTHWQRQIDWHSNLQSFGLVVISLLANQLWKPGLVRGLFSAAVVIGVTWLIVRFGLMEFTNFRLSGVTYVYEGLASSILASPKAYIILVVTAFIASHMNLRYSWDFSGILIPALIALQWYQPAKILSSFVEAAIIYLLAAQVLKLPFLAGVTIEGARKLLLFFNVSFAYKLVLGHLLAWLAFDVKTTDFYGFGYLLSTLLAIKAFDKNIFTRVMRGTLEVSFIGAVAGNIIGFVLAALVPATAGASASAPDEGETSDTAMLLAAATGAAHLQARGGERFALDAAQAIDLASAIELLDSGARPDFVAPGLARIGFVLSRQDDGTIAIARREGSGRDLLLFRPDSTRKLAVIVPDAAARPGISAAAYTLFRTQGARWLLVAAAAPSASRALSGTVDVLRGSVRLAELIVEPAAIGENAAIILAGGGAIAADMDGLRHALPATTTTFSANTAQARDSVTLHLDTGALVQLVQAPPLPQLPPSCGAPLQGKAKPREPDIAILGFIRFEMVEPLVQAMARQEFQPVIARRAAQLAGLSLDRCLIGTRLQWRVASPDGTLGSYFLAPRGEAGRMIETVANSPEVLAAGAAIYRSWNAQALLIAPSQERVTGGQRSLFGVISQALAREQADSGVRLLQIRPAPGEAVALAGEAELAVVPDMVEARGEWGNGLAALGRLAGYRTILANRTRLGAGLEIASNPAQRYLDQITNHRYATLWVLPSLGKDARRE